MGNCHHANAKSIRLSVDLSQLDPQHPLVTISLLTSQSTKDLFYLIRRQLPIRASSSCFQFALGQRKIRISPTPLHVIKIREDTRLVLEFVDGKAMVQVNVEMQGGDQRVNLWVPGDETIRSLRKLMSKRTRLPEYAMRLSVDKRAVDDSSTIGSISHFHTLSLQFSSSTAIPITPSERFGLSLVTVCDNSTCPIYLQQANVLLGHGCYEFPALLSQVKCATCQSSCTTVEQLRFRACEVFFEGLDEDGEEFAGSEVFACTAGELMKGRRVAWRRLRMDVSPLTPDSLHVIS